MAYVDGFLIAVPRKNVKAYEKMARMGKKMWMKFGALDYKECVGDDLDAQWGTSFPKLLKLKKDETVFFSYIVYKSRKHRDAVNKKVMQEMGDPQMEMPFEIKRMSFGGFKVLVTS